MNAVSEFNEPSIKNNLSQKPPRMKFIAESVPAAMREAARWVGWRWQRGNSKWTKVPIDLHNDQFAKTNDANTWCDFTTASNAASTTLVDGVGFVLGGGFCGVDFDNCRNPTTKGITTDVLAYVQRLATYGEVSPSGEGVKLFLRGTIPPGKCKNGNVEMYDQNRFFVVTGHRLVNCGVELANSAENLAAVYGELISGSDMLIELCRETGQDDQKLAIAALQSLSPSRADDYEAWLLAGMALRAVDDRLFAEWDKWSKQSAKYSEGCCAEKWQSFNSSGVKLGSLIYWAKQDTPGWSPSGSRPLTDLGNAERFVSQHRNLARHVAAWDKWLTWDGTRWKIDKTFEASRMAQATVRAISEDKWRKTSESHARITAMIKLAATQRDIAIDYQALDSDPWLLNCTNGTVDLRTGNLRPHDPNDLLTKSTGVSFPDADVCTPEWDKFLNSTFKGDTELIAFLQRLIGYAATGVISEHVLPILWGYGSNGKSTLLNAILDTLGDYGAQAPRNFLMVRRGDAHPTELTDLFGARFVSIAETEDGQRLDEGLVKMLTGGERIRARRMREDFWEFIPTHTPFLATNHKPVVRGGDYGIWRRLLLVPFTATFVDSSELAQQPGDPIKDKLMPDKLKAEAPGILKWIVQGCLEWQKNGLKEPNSVKAATKEYRDDSDTFKKWFEECCVRKTDSKCKAEKAYSSYSAWCTNSGEQQQTQVKFARKLKQDGFEKVRYNDGRYYLGFSILDRDPEVQPSLDQNVGPPDLRPTS